MDGIYNNTGYRNTRNRKQILILDVDDSASDNHLGSGGQFNIPLFEPLIIDKQSEVYLDNFITYNSNISNTTANSAYCLKINEFNINSNAASSTNNNEIFNSIIIPNEHNSASNNHSVVLHKAKKFNYICDINPGKIGSISGKITNLNGEPIFHGPRTSDIFTYALTGIDSGAASDLIFAGESTFEAMTGVTPTSTSGSFLVNQQAGSTTLHFSTNTEISAIEDGGSGTDITFTGVKTPSGSLLQSGGNVVVITNSTGTNANLHLITTDGRFVAEFSINSRE